jgi:uncharacterized membrane protein YbaN (DUF454 family)
MIHKLSVLPISIFLVILYFLFSGLSKDPTLIPSPLIGKPFLNSHLRHYLKKKPLPTRTFWVKHIFLMYGEVGAMVVA